MKTTTREEGDVIIVAVDGQIMHEDVEPFREALNKAVGNGWTKAVLDMEKCDYAVSMCLAVILRAKKMFLAVNGDVRIARYNHKVGALLSLSNLMKKVDLFDTVDEAVASFS